ncbi:MAG: 3-ketoacyl-ACP reductase [Bacteroidetes bacterium HGW-Bacteroidetes-2]|nr:MAG: 3-ketoacyl-ACP reductase [Bacteroidetes bacterium HGW-Bacteroidetes-2]
MDVDSKEPVSFATISFGNGLGSFADANGYFLFDKKKYEDVDSLFVSSMGYKELHLATNNLLETYTMTLEIDQLQEVVLFSAKRGKFKTREIKPLPHTNYFHSWLPTVESEVAVLFNKIDNQSTKIATLLFPINIEESVGGKSSKTRAFSTMLRAKFYENKNGYPGNEINYGNVVFVVTEEDKKELFELDVTERNIFIPQNGLFVAIQVLGTTDEKGVLLQTKKYNEIKTPKGIQKVSITFRPLLPFTNAIQGEKTFVRRIFFNNRKWQTFNLKYNPNSELIVKGYTNYGMGAKLHVYENE